MAALAAGLSRRHCPSGVDNDLDGACGTDWLRVHRLEYRHYSRCAPARAPHLRMLAAAWGGALGSGSVVAQQFRNLLQTGRLSHRQWRIAVAFGLVEIGAAAYQQLHDI